MKKFLKYLFGTIGVFVAILIAISLWKAHEPTQTISLINLDDGMTATERHENALKTAGAHWAVSSPVDEMTDKPYVFASVTSINEVDFDFPYDGGSVLTMNIREKDNESDVFFRISKGQFVCSEYSGTDIITMRFDDEAPQKFKASESSTNDSKYLFVARSSDAKKIIQRCKTAKAIKVKLNFFSEGSRIFNFEVEEPLAY